MRTAPRIQHVERVSGVGVLGPDSGERGMQFFRYYPDALAPLVG